MLQRKYQEDMAFACCKPSTVKCMEGLKSAASVYMEERDVTGGNPITLKMFKLVSPFGRQLERPHRIKETKWFLKASSVAY
jgi:hypothetical protein